MMSSGDTSHPRTDLLGAVRVRLGAGDTEGVRALLSSVPSADVAALLEDIEEGLRAHLFRALDTETAAEVLDELGEGYVQDLAEEAPRRLEAAVGAMEPDEVVDVLDVLPAARAEALMESFGPEQASTAEQLRAYPPDTAGGLMTTQFVSLPASATAREAIELTQHSRDTETVGHLFVADESGRLAGNMPLQRLVFAPPDRLVGDLMEEYPYAVAPGTDQEELVRAATRYDLDAVPVVDADGRLIGVVTVDDILEAAEQEADEDIYRLAGTGERDPVHASVLQGTRHRLPWLLLSVLDGMFIALVVSRFQDTLQVVQLAFFIPLIPLMGGQVAIQSSTIIVRGLALGDFRRRALPRFLVRQFGITCLLAVSCSCAAGVLGLLLVGASVQVMAAVGLAVGLAILISGTLGVTLPLAFNAVGIDPAVSAGPFITMLNDLICIVIYLSLGLLLTPPAA